MKNQDQVFIFEVSKEGRARILAALPKLDVEEVKLEDAFESDYIRVEDGFSPEVSELDIMRHYTALSNRIPLKDSGFIHFTPKKYNLKSNESTVDLKIFIRCKMKRDSTRCNGIQCNDFTRAF